MLEEIAQADGILSAIMPSAKKPAAKKAKAKKKPAAKKATAKKPAAKKKAAAKKKPAAKKAVAKKKPAAKKKAAAKKPAAKKAVKKTVKKAAKKPAAKKAKKAVAKKPAAKKAVKKTAKKATKKPAAKKAKKAGRPKAKKSVKKLNDAAAVNLKVFTSPASSKAEQSSSSVKKGIENLGSSLMSFAQDQLQETVLTAQQLMNCRSLEDVTAVQSQFVKQSFERLVKQASKMAQSSANIAKTAAEPLSNRMQSLFYANRAA